jgi:glycosyltransferase involved in cell wall biosynthesis
MKKLAICIPTYNRAKLLNRLLKSIPALPNIIVSICDDGSNDNTFEVIKNHKSRFSIRYIYQENEGRASALRKSILNVSAEFMLIMGSDDYFTKNGISSILNSIKDNKTIKFFVFSTIISTNKGLKSESLKKIPITSYISVRSDYNIKRDLKEVVDHQLITKVMYGHPKNIRRIPTSYLWFKLSEKVDCMTIDSDPVIIIEYSNDGMSKNLLPLKINNPKYIALTYKIAIKSKKYSSIIYRLKYSILYYRYSFHNNNAKLLKFYHLPYFVIGYIIKFIDKTRLFIQSNKFNL